MNITLDTAAPNLSLEGIESVVYEPQFNLSGTTEAGASLTVNGKLVLVGGSGEFQNSITLSPGSNTIVIESKDRAGNAVRDIFTVTLAEDSALGTNWAAISVMILLAVVGLILGLMFGRILLPGEPMEEEPPEDEIPEDMDAEESEDLGDEIPEEDIPEDIEGEDMEVPAEIPEGAEPIPVEEGMPEDMPEDEIPGEDIPEDDIPEDVEGEIPDEDIPEDDMPEDVEGEESLESEEVEEEPVDISEEITTEEEALEEELPEDADSLDEDALESEDADSSESDVDSAESEEVPEAEEDPRIAKLRDAFESGKISEELYEKNLARFKGE